MAFSNRAVSALDGRRLTWPRMVTILLALVLILPLLTIVGLALSPSENIWPHLWATVLPGYIWRTLVLMLGVGALSLIIGTTLAWLITMYDFPGRSWLAWGALMPLAMPSYIISYTYVDFLSYSGGVQTSLRSLMGWQSAQDYWFPEIRSMAGAILVLSLVLYPYVFMAARMRFLDVSRTQIDVARTLGRSRRAVFWTIVLPLARPGLVVGVSLVLMECLNDIAAVGFFGVETLTLGIYTTWLGQGNLGGAAQLAFVLLVFVFALITIERKARRRERQYAARTLATPLARMGLTQGAGLAALLVVFVPVLLGFILPAGILSRFAWRRLDQVFTADYLNSAWHSVLLASLAGGVTLLIGLVLAYNDRNSSLRWLRGLIRLATSGYAVPGTILGLGVLVPLAWFDNRLSGWMSSLFNLPTGLVLSGSVFAIILAYVIRFMAISHGSLDAGLQNVTPNIDAAARTLGRGPWRVIFDIHLPMLKTTLITAGLLVFVDAMKELPATLILRPFDFETLATQVFLLASLDQLEDSAIPALTIIAVGLAPVILLTRHMTPRR
jgi:iron(III) transport system permease protein